MWNASTESCFIKPPLANGALAFHDAQTKATHVINDKQSYDIYVQQYKR